MTGHYRNLLEFPILTPYLWPQYLHFWKRKKHNSAENMCSTYWKLFHGTRKPNIWPKWQQKTFGPDLAVFWPKIVFLGVKSENFCTHISGASFALFFSCFWFSECLMRGLMTRKYSPCWSTLNSNKSFLFAVEKKKKHHQDLLTHRRCSYVVWRKKQEFHSIHSKCTALVFSV